MTYTVIPDADIDQDSPVTQPLMTALRDNPIAIAAGDAGAPRIVDAALDTTVTAAGTTWVINRNAGASVGAVGTYAFLYGASTIFPPPEPGITKPGSELRYSDADNTVGSAPAGTWRCMGGPSTTSTTAQATLWLRIS